MGMPRLRFGLLTLCSLMLIAIGVAGWVRERIGRVDEQEVFDALAAEGIEYEMARGAAVSGEPGRLKALILYGRPTEKTLDKVYALASLDRVEHRPTVESDQAFFERAYAVASDTNGNRSRLSPPTFEEMFGIDAPALESGLFEWREPTAAPSGIAVTDAERNRALAAAFEAWKTADERLGERWMATSRVPADAWYGAPDDAEWLTLSAVLHDGEREATYDLYARATVTLTTPEGDLRAESIGADWRTIVADRGTSKDFGEIEGTQDHLRSPYAGPSGWRRLLPRTASSDLVSVVESLDDGRYLFRLRSVELEREVDPTDLPPGPWSDFPDASYVAEGHLVVDPELHWAVVSSRFELGNPNGEKGSEIQEEQLEYERRGETVLPVRRQIYVNTPHRGDLTNVLLGGETKRVVVHCWEIDPQFNPRRLSLEGWDVPTLRARQNPIVPWYYTTFAIGCVGLGYALWRRCSKPSAHQAPSENEPPLASLRELDEPPAPL